MDNIQNMFSSNSLLLNIFSFIQYNMNTNCFGFFEMHDDSIQNLSYGILQIK